MKKSPFLLLLGAAAALFLSGCGSSAITAGLGVELAGLERTSTGVKATLRYVNPNVTVYNIDRSTHKVYLDGALAGTITVRDPFGVPAQQVVTQEVALDGGAAPSPGERAYRMESDCTIRLYADNMQGMKTASTGSVVVK